MPDNFEHILKTLLCLNQRGSSRQFSWNEEQWDLFVGNCLDLAGTEDDVAFRIVPGDRVVIAVVDPIPSLEKLLPTIVRRIATAALSDSDTGPDIQIALTQGVNASSIEQVPVGLPISIHLHDPDEEKSHAILAPGCNDQPLVVHRVLFDADVVIVMSCPTLSREIGLTSGLFPEFADTACREHSRKQRPKQRRADQQQVESALGADYQIAVISGPGGEILDIACGRNVSVRERSRDALTRAWTLPLERQFPIVIATIETLTRHLVWQDVESAIETSVAIAEPSAPIVLLTTIDKKPPSAIRMAMEASFDDMHDQRQERPSPLRDVLAERPVYLLSKLSRSIVEDIGLGFLEGPDELQRLVNRFEGGCVIRDAHRCRADSRVADNGN